MAIKDLMRAVRTGDFEPKFKKCASLEDKINLFKKYGVIISLDQYKEIEAKVASIKQGSESSYEVLENKVECNDIEGVPEGELVSIAGGRMLSKEEHAVFEVLKRMPDSKPNSDNSKKDDDIKLWETKPFLTGRGLF